jgi:hypothetical protein
MGNAMTQNYIDLWGKHMARVKKKKRKLLLFANYTLCWWVGIKSFKAIGVLALPIPNTLTHFIY